MSIQFIKSLQGETIFWIASNSKPCNGEKRNLLHSSAGHSRLKNSFDLISDATMEPHFLGIIELMSSFVSVRRILLAISREAILDQKLLQSNFYMQKCNHVSVASCNLFSHQYVTIITNKSIFCIVIHNTQFLYVCPWP